MIEVEVKIKVEDPGSIELRLLGQGFKRSNRVRETDIYFNGVDRDFRESDEALRIRRTESLDGSCVVADGSPEDVLTTLTYKGRKIDRVSMSRTEIETNVEDFEVMKEILIKLGYKPVTPVVKSRKYFFSEEMAACMDSVEGLGDFLELEVITESALQRPQALELIANQLEKLGLSMDDTTTTSYLSMIENL